MEREIRQLGAVLIGLLVVVAVTLGYWQVLRAPELEAAPNNPRLAEEAARVLRGAILDRTGRPLARSELTPDGVARRYSDPSVAAVTGYHSIRFGSSGLEAAFDEQLGDVGRHLQRAAQSYNRAVASLDSRVRVSARRLGEHVGVETPGGPARVAEDVSLPGDR